MYKEKDKIADNLILKYICKNEGAVAFTTIVTRFFFGPL